MNQVLFLLGLWYATELSRIRIIWGLFTKGVIYKGLARYGKPKPQRRVKCLNWKLVTVQAWRERGRKYFLEPGRKDNHDKTSGFQWRDPEGTLTLPSTLPLTSCWALYWQTQMPASHQGSLSVKSLEGTPAPNLCSWDRKVWRETKGKSGYGGGKRDCREMLKLVQFIKRKWGYLNILHYLLNTQFHLSYPMDKKQRPFTVLTFFLNIYNCSSVPKAIWKDSD